MLSHPRIEEILHFWFGNVEEALPTKAQTHLWFSGDSVIDTQIKEKFNGDLETAIQNKYMDWEYSARGSLALILLFDQFTRNIYRHTSLAFAYDQKALDLCLAGIEKKFDHNLSLIERAFFYMPLIHAEDLEMQNISIRAFQTLYDLSFPETQAVFKAFFEYAIRHYQVVKTFGRFPQRNEALGRPSTQEEVKFLASKKAKF